MLSDFKFTPPSAQNFLAGCALMFLGVLGVIMCCHTVPAANHDFIVFILGALSGATTAVGAQKAIGTVTATAGTSVSSTPAPAISADQPII